jgi:diguanylate cyclase (GGDEF)-like protein
MTDEQPKPASQKTVVGVPALSPQRPAEKLPYILLIEGEHSGMMLRIPETGSLVIGRDPAADVTLNDERCSRRHARIYADGAGTIFVEDLGSTNRTLVNGDAVEGPRELADGDRIHIGTSAILKFSLQDELEERFQKNLYHSATRDPLTGAFNKRSFVESLGRAVRHYERTKAPLALVLFDLDHFKRVNDTWGHPAGDEVLKAVCQAVSGALRPDALLCRTGGEEFAVILASTTAAEALSVAVRLGFVVRVLPIPIAGGSLRVTLSLGVASISSATPTAEALVAAADEALYRAKRGGRDQAVVSSSSGSSAGS